MPGRARGCAACAVPPGSTCTLIGLPARPLAAALAMRRASAVNDISIIVLDAATFATSEFPSASTPRFREWRPASAGCRARRERHRAESRHPLLLVGGWILANLAAGGRADLGGRIAVMTSAMAGAADPMMTTLEPIVLELVAAAISSPGQQTIRPWARFCAPSRRRRARRNRIGRKARCGESLDLPPRQCDAESERPLARPEADASAAARSAIVRAAASAAHAPSSTVPVRGGNAVPDDIRVRYGCGA